MLTKSRVEKILGLVKKEYDYMDNKPINIYIRNYKNDWKVELTSDDYSLCIRKEYNNDSFAKFFYQYLAEKFNFDLTWAKVDYENTITALALLHEIGHIKQTINIDIDYDYVEKMNKEYNKYKFETMFMSKQERSIAYRKISYEYLADKFAVEMFNKYAVKILAILNNTTQKEIKNKLVEAKKKIA